VCYLGIAYAERDLIIKFLIQHKRPSMKQNTSTFRLGLLCALALLGSAPALAQTDSYPNKPITIVVAYPPGGSTDLTGRTLGVELSKLLGVPVVIQNIGGAGGAIGAQKSDCFAADGACSRKEQRHQEH
jgi:hypothetical protein